MADQSAPRARYGEAFWRAHHEAWKRSDLNQREYCESQGISLKAFGNWWAKFKAEPEAPQRKLLYRRGGASHSLSHSLSHRVSHSLSHRVSHRVSHSLSHGTYPSSAPGAPLKNLIRTTGLDRRTDRATIHRRCLLS